MLCNNLDCEEPPQNLFEESNSRSLVTFILMVNVGLF